MIPEGVVVLCDNPNYALCKACGGTGWMYYTTEKRSFGYMTCHCSFGALRAEAIKEEMEK